MPTLEYIRISKEKKLLLLGISEEGERYRYTVGESFYLSLGSPPVGYVFSESEMCCVKGEDDRIRATKKALSILSYADNNERALVAKLTRAGFSREISESVAAEMVGCGYINESRQLERLVLREANVNLSGYSKFLPKLLAKGYSAKVIKSVTLSLVNSGEIDFKANAGKLIEKKLSKDATSAEKKTLLYKYGYKI